MNRATDAQGQRDREDRAPVELGRARRRRAAARAPRSRRRVPDQSAIDFVRAGPDQSAVISASVVGNAMPAASPPTTRAANRTSIEGARAASRRRRDRQRHAQDEHHLAPVAVAQRAEVEHGGGEAERVADRDEVERGLPRVEGRPDDGQRDVRDGQVQIRDRRHDDEGGEDQRRTLGADRCVRRGLHDPERVEGRPRRTASAR